MKLNQKFQNRINYQYLEQKLNKPKIDVEIKFKILATSSIIIYCFVIIGWYDFFTPYNSQSNHACLVQNTKNYVKWTKAKYSKIDKNTLHAIFEEKQKHFCSMKNYGKNGACVWFCLLFVMTCVRVINCSVRWHGYEMSMSSFLSICVIKFSPSISMVPFQD